MLSRYTESTIASACCSADRTGTLGMSGRAAACSAVAALLALSIASAGTQREARAAPPGIGQPAAGPVRALAAPSRP